MLPAAGRHRAPGQLADRRSRGRRSRLQDRRSRVDPDRHRGRLPAQAGGHPAASRSPGTSTRRCSTSATSRTTACCSATAERADVIVDFSQYAGKTLILYNDAPTAFPALDPRTDYYTGDPDLTDTGGTESTKAGYGPNTRTDHADQGRGGDAGTGVRPAQARTTPSRSTDTHGGRLRVEPEPDHRPGRALQRGLQQPRSRPMPVRAHLSRTEHDLQDARRRRAVTMPLRAQGHPGREGRGVRSRVRAHERQARPRAARHRTLPTRTSSCTASSTRRPRSSRTR